MRLSASILKGVYHLQLVLATLSAVLGQQDQQSPLLDTTRSDPRSNTITTPFFAELERLARLVDITYCVGTTGVSKPFQCVSRCSEFPSLSLVTTWNTGALMSDSCGYIAVDHGTKPGRPAELDQKTSALPIGDPAIVVAFRGTYSITNTVMDLSTVPQKYVPYPSPDDGSDAPPEKPEHECTNCTVHMGFIESWRNARQLVIPELKRLREQHPTYPIQLIGHSLGGAVACLAALELKVSLGWEDIEITTFGEPRVGNYELARFVDEVFHLDGQINLEERSYRRVTHTNDPVPLLPLGEWGYRSHAGEVFISKQDLTPSEDDVTTCVGDTDPECIAGADDNFLERIHRFARSRGGLRGHLEDVEATGLFSRFKLWQLFFAHRDYFWRLGLCVPGGDPANWGRDKYRNSRISEL